MPIAVSMPARPRSPVAPIWTWPSSRWRGPLDVEPLAGGLTNRNYQVTTGPGGEYVARFRGAKSDLLAIDRDAEYHNCGWRPLGVGPRVVEYRRPSAASCSSNGSTGAPSPTPTSTTETNLRRVAAACRRLHAGPAVRGDFDMFDVQRALPRIVREHGFRLPDGYLDFEPQVGGSRPRCAVRPRRPVAVPQRPARREHHGRRRAALVHRLRVLRQQRPVLRARQHLERGRARRDRLEHSSRLLRRAVAPVAPRGPGCSA